MGEIVDNGAHVVALDELTARQAGFFDRALKRALDVAVSVSLLVLLSPVFLLCALAIKLESRGPVFYRASRVGSRRKPLHVLKFRKMKDGAAGRALTGSHDPRFTRMGRFLALSKLDELPQLWNVLLGQMSLVGPRPEDWSFVDLYEREFDDILVVRPGVTGLSQLAFAREAEVLDPSDPVAHYVGRILPQKVSLDRLYARRRSIGMDVRIMFWTVIPVLLRRDVAVNRDSGHLTMRRRPSSPEPRSSSRA
jgi:lipopolysaccharide/colanic/teichoic acid biosynthesis glycosyltransferase